MRPSVSSGSGARRHGRFSTTPPAVPWPPRRCRSCWSDVARNAQAARGRAGRPRHRDGARYTCMFITPIRGRSHRGIWLAGYHLPGITARVHHRHLSRRVSHAYRCCRARSITQAAMPAEANCRQASCSISSTRTTSASAPSASTARRPASTSVSIWSKAAMIACGGAGSPMRSNSRAARRACSSAVPAARP